MNEFPLSVPNTNNGIVFTHDQEVAVDGLIDFIAAPWSINNYINALCGAGGVGKTFVTKYVIDNCRFSNSVIFCAAPTHKACRVLSKAIGGKKVNTIQSLFGLRLDVNIDNFDPNNPAFNPIGKNKMITKDGICMAQLLIVDEASMLNAKLVKWICDFAKKNEVKVLFIGDASQLSPVNERKSQAFLIANKVYYLKEVVRQGVNNPISKLLTLLREDIDNTHSWKFLEYINLHKHEVNEIGAGFTVCGKRDFVNIVSNCFKDDEYTKNIDLYRIIAYTNVRVTAWNNFIRKLIIPNSDKSVLSRHDLLMSYTTIVNEFMEIIINNSDEYIIKDILDTVDPTYGFKGFVVKFQAIRGGDVSKPLFIIDHTDSYTCQMYYKQLTSLIDAAKSAGNKSTRASKWKAYFDFKKKYLIATNILDPVSNKIIFERDIDYGFAITSHRAQGSTYKTVFVDVNDMIYDKNGRPYTDRGELLRRLYVACSRASHELVICYGN